MVNMTRFLVKGVALSESCVNPKWTARCRCLWLEYSKLVIYYRLRHYWQTNPGYCVSWDWWTKCADVQSSLSGVDDGRPRNIGRLISADSWPVINAGYKTNVAVFWYGTVVHYFPAHGAALVPRSVYCTSVTGRYVNLCLLQFGLSIKSFSSDACE